MVSFSLGYVKGALFKLRFQFYKSLCPGLHCNPEGNRYIERCFCTLNWDRNPAKRGICGGKSKGADSKFFRAGY